MYIILYVIVERTCAFVIVDLARGYSYCVIKLTLTPEQVEMVCRGSKLNMLGKPLPVVDN